MTTVGHQHGVGLLEVLVALLVFSVGVLGATALSVQAYRLENRALVRARIGMLTADLIGRMRANTSGSAAYGGEPDEHQCSSGTEPARICTPEELAADDLSYVHTTLQALAPTATLELSLDDSDLPLTGVLSVEWRDGETTQRYRTAFAL